MFNSNKGCIASQKKMHLSDWNRTFWNLPMSDSYHHSQTHSRILFHWCNNNNNIDSKKYTCWSRFVATCQWHETLQKTNRKELLNHHIFVGNLCVVHLLCVWKAATNTIYRKGYGKKVVIRQKHIISSVGEMLLVLPIYISHELLHMVYQIFAFSVCRGHFTAKLNNFKASPTWRFAFLPPSSLSRYLCTKKNSDWLFLFKFFVLKQPMCFPLFVKLKTCWDAGAFVLLSFFCCCCSCSCFSYSI